VGREGAPAYDLVVVGAGSAGCVLANRLSEDPRRRVLLLEAGPRDTSPWLSIPAGTSKVFFHPQLNWGYTSEPEPNLDGRRLYWPRGKALGGSSAVNGMAYVRGHPADYDRWRQKGAVGWSWNDVLPYFKRSERNVNLGGEQHASQGELGVSDPDVRHRASAAFIEAVQSLGVPARKDLNDGEQEGVGFLQFTIRNGVRQSTSRAFLAPARGRPNLHIVTEALAERVLFEGRRAVGVAYRRHGELRDARGGEIILAGGAINSPQILMLSGIGPAEHLREHGVEVLHDLPEVGKNLQDHVSVTLRAEMQRGFSINDQIAGPRLAPHVLNYLLRRKGLLTLGASQASAFLRSGPHVEHPDLQINFRPLSFAFSKAGKMQPDRIPAVTASVVHLRPQSTGRVWLASRDPSDAPKMVANYLSTAEDRRAILAGVRWGQRIFGAAPLRERMSKPLEPTSDATDEALLAFSRARAASMCHPVSTCRMGGDEGSVVDPRLRVRGVENLRVVDASIMPDIVSGNTNAPAIMIGERGAALILEDAKAG